MSGFLPRGYFRLAEIRDVMGVDELGSWLASGEMIAAARDTDGSIHELDPAGWMDEGAAGHVSAGELPAKEGVGPFPLFVRSRDPRHLIAIMDVRRKRAAEAAAPRAANLAPTRSRGPRPTVSTAIMAKMRALDPTELATMKEEVMAATFGAGRTTCREARNKVLAELRQTASNDK